MFKRILIIAAVAIVLLACGTSTASKIGSSSPGSSSPASSTASSFKVGDVVKVGDWQVTVNSFKVVQGDDFTQPTSGDQFIGLDVSIQNTSSSSQTISSLLNFSIKDATGQKYNESLLTNQPAPPDGAVEANGLLRGTLAYEVPQSQKTFTFTFDATGLGDTTAIWSLSLS